MIREKYLTLSLLLNFRKPLISSFGMKSKMEGRTMVKMSRLHLKTGTSALSGDWVTIGVLVQKLDPKTSANVSVKYLLEPISTL